MRTLLIILLAVFISESAYSQKVKIDKKTGIMSEDKVIITDKKTGKTMLLDGRRYETQLKEIAADCEDMIKNIEIHKYRIPNRKIMLDFVKDYNECK